MVSKRNAALFLLSFVGLICSSFLLTKKQAPQKQVLKRIVIDAGHGGADFGASGSFSKEKDIALSIALKLEKMLETEMPEIDLVMTRRTDVFDNPRRKAQIANEANGDLFVCIHVNQGGKPIRHSEFIGYKTETYYKKKKKYTRKVKDYRYWYTPSPAKGTETFIYGVDKSDDAKEALSEHENMFLDSASAQELKDLSSDDPTKRMILNMKTQSYFSRSASLAMTIEEEFEKVGRISREAKQRQKGIWVLQAVAMPAVLVETGFISNPDEETYLNSEEGQQEICEVLVRSLKRYRYSLEKQASGAQNPPK